MVRPHIGTFAKINNKVYIEFDYSGILLRYSGLRQDPYMNKERAFGNESFLYNHSNGLGAKGL